MHCHNNIASRSWQDNPGVRPHRVLLWARSFHLEGDVVVAEIRQLHGARDLLLQLKGEAELDGVDAEEFAGGGWSGRGHCRRRAGGGGRSRAVGAKERERGEEEIKEEDKCRFDLALVFPQTLGVLQAALPCRRLARNSSSPLLWMKMIYSHKKCDIGFMP